MTEEDLRKHIRALKRFYTDLVIYGAVVMACVFVWFITGGGTFWPIWVLFGLGISALTKAISLGQLPHLADFFPFLRPEWEEEQLKTLKATEESPATMADDISRHKKDAS